jgi:hypothetical protein
MLCIDLFCGLGGWAEGFLSEGWDVIGFDIERHRYPKRHQNGTAIKQGLSNEVWFDKRVDERRRAVPFTGEWDEYPAQLVIQDVLTLHGSQFRNADCIVASPPCQAYSYRAMPWKRAKALPPPSNELFDACFRIQREAIEAAGRYIPLIVENVCGAQRWVGPARWHYGSYYLWGDVPALMPSTLTVSKTNTHGPTYGDGSWFAVAKNGGKNDHLNGGSWFAIAHNTTSGHGKNPAMRRGNSHSPARKAASAAIAKIPFELAAYIARVYKPAARAS